MDDIKYLGVQGLEELIILTQNALAKKADVLQFEAMPDPTEYIGKIVQYVGISDISFTRSHFYYSNGIKWAEENISGEPKIKMVTALPSWVDSDPQVLYILKNTADITMNFYVKNPSVNDAWFTVEKSASFVVVAYLPQWADADPSIIYFKANGNDLVGYIKNTSTTDAWYTFGEKPIIDTAISATSTNPLQNKVIFTEIQGLHDSINTNGDAISQLNGNINANSNAINRLNGEVQDLRGSIDACQNADEQLRKDIGINSTAISRVGGEVQDLRDNINANSTIIGALDGEIRDLRDNINACQNADEQLREDNHINGVAIERIDSELHTLATTVREHGTKISSIDDIDNEVQDLRTDVRTHTAVISRLQNENVLSDFEDITISTDESAPTRMEYDGYITVIDSEASGTRLYINGICVSSVDHSYTRYTAVTVFVAKNDEVYFYYPSKSLIAKARFYKLRDYTNRPSKA